ncbi:MAG TPA: hypothetical protein VK469_07875 [Candidatus Kapabacteria bacterium]|nr:hypothetical protein [Candidatus Kapabacteria bacterium]
MESISYNHDSDCNTCDAINIRMNLGKEVPILEWEKGKESYPAAYIKNRHVILKVVFSASTGVKTARISAIKRGGHFGNLKEKLVCFDKCGRSGTICLDVPGKTPKKIKAYDQEWDWYCRDINGSGSGKVKIGSSKNRIYILLDEPQSPWKTTGESKPWADALEYSCKWAAGATKPELAAARITKHLYNDIGGYYSQYPHYTDGSPNWFKLQNFLTNVSSTSGVGKANCFDMAKALVTFSNAVGCDMSYKICIPLGDRLECIKFIGNPRNCQTLSIPHAFACIKDRVFEPTFKIYKYNREEWIVNTKMDDYLRMVIKKGPRRYPTEFPFEITDV